MGNKNPTLRMWGTRMGGCEELFGAIGVARTAVRSVQCMRTCLSEDQRRGRTREERGMEVRKKNKNPTLRMWGKKKVFWL